jgi:hypothetical protein
MKTLLIFLFVVNFLFAALNLAFFFESGGAINLVSGMFNGFAAWLMYKSIANYA